MGMSPYTKDPRRDTVQQEVLVADKPVPLTVRPDPVVRLDRPKLRAGGWYDSGSGRRATSARERLGYSHAAVTSSLYETPTSHYSFYRQYRSLMPAQYWQLYKSTPDVRACVDSIVRRIATWDWYVKPMVDPRESDKYAAAMEVADRARDFLQVPDENGSTWQETMTALVTDLLVYDAGAMELVKDAEGNLKELVVWLGSEWFPVTDKHGHLLHYEQDTENDQFPPLPLSPENLAYFRLFKNTRSNLGLPLLESVINECITTILADEHAMLALDADEIPPGLLVLGGVAGPAAERARADLQTMRGKDHSIRVVTSPQPQGIEAKWVELRHTPKELELREVVEAMRHTIWRVFGVTPVELGDTSGIPRASAEVQMDVASSHLITPILELLQARINAQIMPALLGEESKLVRFSFDRTAPATAKERLDDAKRAETLLKNGVVTINEMRSELGLLPVDGGDQPLLHTSVGPLPLASIAEGGAAELFGAGNGAAMMPDENAAEPDENEPEPPRLEEPDTDLELSVKLDRSRGHHRSIRHDTVGCSCCDETPPPGDNWPTGDGWRDELRARSVRDWLPSDWQSPGRFDGFRTLDLTDLAEVVARYTMEATALYADATDEVLGIVRAAYGSDGKLGTLEATEAQRRIDDALDALVIKWRFRTAPLYEEAAELGKRNAAEWMGIDPIYDAQLDALNYQNDAMAWLGDSRGLVGTLRDNLRAIVDAAALDQRSRASMVDPEMDPDEVLDIIDQEFAVQANRIENWSGKLVPVASSSAMASTASVVVLGRPPLPGSVSLPVSTGAEQAAPTVWFYEWAASAGRNCATCADEGGAGFRPLGTASILPGQGTICGARCRCVLVFWTEGEIKGGVAIKLSEL